MATVFGWQNFRAMLVLVKAQEKIVKAMNQVGWPATASLIYLIDI